MRLLTSNGLQQQPGWANSIGSGLQDKKNVPPGDFKATTVSLDSSSKQGPGPEDNLDDLFFEDLKAPIIYTRCCLNQVCTYSYAWQARYGCSITNLGLTFVRVFRPMDATSRKRGPKNLV